MVGKLPRLSARIPRPPARGARPMVRTAREHEAIIARNMVDMQDKCCGHSNDIHPTHSQYKGNHKRGGRAGQRPPPLYIGFELGECRSSDHNTCLACRYDWTSMFRAIMTSCSPAVRTMRACAQGLAPQDGGSGGAFGPPRAVGVFGGGTPPSYSVRKR